ncbi:MAG: hypothetical protein FJ118_13725 [Deltaproteobacteria bacterium]|nr:hypothetical protein [Deltaproteobacteria bacterium]
MARTDRLGKTSLLIVILLILVTFGFYIPIWLIRARSTLTQLKTTSRMPRYFPYGFLFLYAVLVLAVIGVEPLTSAEPAWEDLLCSFLLIVDFFAHAFLAVRVVDILDEYSRGGLTSRRTVSWLRACFLSIVYLQYEMNRLPAPVDGICPSQEEPVEGNDQVRSRSAPEQSRN